MDMVYPKLVFLGAAFDVNNNIKGVVPDLNRVLKISELHGRVFVVDVCSVDFNDFSVSDDIGQVLDGGDF